MKNGKQNGSVELPKDLSFATNYNCKNCKWFTGDMEGEKIYCDYYKSYYYPNEGYDCNHFLE